MATREELIAEAKRRGLTIPQSTSPSREDLIAEAQKRGLIPTSEPMNKDEAVSRGWQLLKDKFQGNAEFKNAGDASDFLMNLAEQGYYKDKGNQFYKDLMAVQDAGVFGNTNDQMKVLSERIPEAQFNQDANQNPMVQLGENRQYINTPGFDFQDFQKISGEAISYAPALKAGGLVNNTLGRGLVTGVASAATNAGNQKLAGRDEIDTTEATAAGLLGGGLEVVSPYVGKLFGWAKNKLTGSAQKIETGKKIASKVGADNLDDNTLELIGKMRSSVDDSVPDDVIIAELQHGLKLTRGQATGSIKQQSAEQQMRQQPVLMDKFRQIDDFNRGQVENNLKNIRSGLYKNVDDELMPQATAETALEGLKTAASDAKNAYRDAYKQVDGLFVKSEAATGLDDRLTKAVYQSGTRLSDRATPKAMEAIEIIKEGQAKLGKGVKGFSLDAYDTQRKQINSLFSKQMDGTDKRALTTIKNELDDWFYSSVDEQLLSGNPEALKQLTKARGLMSDYMNRFQNKEEAQGVIKKILDKDVTPEQFSDMLVGVNGYSKNSAANAVKAYEKAVGRDSEAFKALQANVFEKMIIGGVNKSTGGAAVKGYEGLIGTFHNAYNKKGTSMMKVLFDNKTGNEIKSLMRSIGKLVTPEEVKNASGSGRFMAQFMNQHGNKFPILSNLWNGVKSVKNYSNATSLPAASSAIEARNAMPILQTVND